jgi:hypothetical protein
VEREEEEERDLTATCQQIQSIENKRLDICETGYNLATKLSEGRFVATFIAYCL